MSTNKLTDDGPYSPKEVAALERVCVLTIYRLLRRGELSGYRLGGSWRITAEALLEYRDRRRAQV